MTEVNNLLNDPQKTQCAYHFVCRTIISFAKVSEK